MASDDMNVGIRGVFMNPRKQTIQISMKVAVIVNSVWIPKVKWFITFDVKKHVGGPVPEQFTNR